MTILRGHTTEGASRFKAAWNLARVVFFLGMVAGCRRQSDEEMARLLTGVWEAQFDVPFQAKNSFGDIEQKSAEVNAHSEFSADGLYFGRGIVSVYEKGTLDYEIEGGWKVVNAKLVELVKVTKSSNLDLPVGKKITTTDTIERLNAIELVLVSEHGRKTYYRRRKTEKRM